MQTDYIDTYGSISIYYIYICVIYMHILYVHTICAGIDQSELKHINK